MRSFALHISFKTLKKNVNFQNNFLHNTLQIKIEKAFMIFFDELPISEKNSKVILVLLWW